MDEPIVKPTDQTPPDGGTPPVGGSVTPPVTPKPWLEQVKTDLRANESLKDINDVNHLTESYIAVSGELNSLRDALKQSIKIPSADAPVEEKEEFYRKLGKPEKPEEYEFPESDTVKNDPETVEWARGMFSKANLTKEQASIIRDEWNQYVVKINQKVEQQLKEERETKLATDMEELRTNWGNKFEENANIARKTMEIATGKNEKLKTWLKDRNMDNDPVLSQLFLDISAAFIDDSAPPPDPLVTKEKTGSGISYPDMP